LSGWGSGYITDISYKAGYYPQQSPYHQAVCGMLCGVRIDMPGPEDPLSYLELGSGIGLGAMMLAASNPNWIVTAIDFNPAHVAMARRTAHASGLTNITFIEADLSTLADEPSFADIPHADFVSLHGVWSWVAPSVQAGIIRLLKARVRPGGVVHVSYNALPGWQGMIGLQRLIREAGSRTAGRSDSQVAEGLELARGLLATEAKHLHQSSFGAGMLERFGQGSPEYLAHELMNQCWTPCFHADVADAMSGARLEWVGSASIAENFPELMLDAPQRELMLKQPDVAMRELVKDMCLGRLLRSDIFVRGANRMSNHSRDQALGELTLGLTVVPEKFSYDMTLPVGTVTMNAPFYGTVVQALGNGPRRVADLVALPGLVTADGSQTRNPAELVGMLIGSDQAEFVVRPGADAGAGARRTNAATARSLVDVTNLGGGLCAASERLGSGMRCVGLELFLIDRVAAVGGWIDPEPWVAELGPELPADQAEKLHGMMCKIAEERLPAWRVAGLI